MEYLKAFGVGLAGIVIGLGVVVLLMSVYLTILDFVWRHSDLYKLIGR